MILFMYIYAHVEKTDVICAKQADSSEYVNLGVVTEQIEQEFICETDNLDAILLKCQVFEELDAGEIRMTVTDVESGSVEASVTIRTDELENGKFHTFVFEKIEGCEGRRYKVSLENTGNVGFICQPETEKDTKLSIAGQQRQGTLIMKTMTKGFDVETFGVLAILLIYIFLFFKLLNRLFSR